MKKIEESVVKHVARLARFSLSDKELELYSSQLTAILSYISKLNEIDTANVPPTSHAISTLKNVFRKDILKSSLGADDVVACAPQKEDGFFRVPRIIEGK